MKINLKPCPFCGGEAEIQRMGDVRQSMIIGCTNCHCQLESPDAFAIQSEHLDWNQRYEETKPETAPQS